MPSSYREQPAPAGLAGVVGCLWRNETPAGREQRVLPDGCMDLIWMDGAVHVAGPDPALGAVVAQLRAGSSVAATAEALGWTDRTLHRRCRDTFGYGSSVLRWILRSGWRCG